MRTEGVNEGLDLEEMLMPMSGPEPETLEEFLDSLQLDWNSGDYQVLLFRLEPDEIDGEPSIGHLKTYPRRITTETIRKHWGGGTYRVMVYGPNPKTGGRPGRIKGFSGIQVRGVPPIAHFDDKKGASLIAPPKVEPEPQHGQVEELRQRVSELQQLLFMRPNERDRSDELTEVIKAFAGRPAPSGPAVDQVELFKLAAAPAGEVHQALAAQTERHHTQLDALRRDHEREIKDLRRDQETVVKELRSTNEAIIKELRSNHERELDRAVKGEESRATIERRGLEIQLASAESKAEKLEGQLESERRQVDTLRDELRRKELELLEARLNIKTSKTSDSMSNLSGLEKTLSDAKRVMGLFGGGADGTTNPESEKSGDFERFFESWVGKETVRKAVGTAVDRLVNEDEKGTKDSKTDQKSTDTPNASAWRQEWEKSKKTSSSSSSSTPLVEEPSKGSDDDRLAFLVESIEQAVETGRSPRDFLEDLKKEVDVQALRLFQMMGREAIVKHLSGSGHVLSMSGQDFLGKLLDLPL